MRRAARAMVATGAGVATLLLAAAVTVVLVPQKEIHPDLVLVAKLDALAQRTPVRVTSTDLAGLDVKAQRLREYGSMPGFGRPRGSVKDLPVYLVRDGNDVRGFIGIDPRNGCLLDTLLMTRDSRVPPSITIFHDECHGSIYDLAGQHIGGPSPWALDEVLVTVRDGRVYVATGSVIPGRLIYR